MKRFPLIRSQWLIVAISAFGLIITVFVVIQIGFRKSEQMLIDKTSGMISINLSKNEMAISDMLNTTRKLSAASSTNRSISELLLSAANEAGGLQKDVSVYSSSDLLRISKVEELLTNYRNTFFDYQVHSVIIGVDGSLYSVLDGVDNSSLFSTNFSSSIHAQPWYEDFMNSDEVSLWVAPCSYNKTGNFYQRGSVPENAKHYILYARKITDFRVQSNIGVVFVSLPTDNLAQILTTELGAGMGIISQKGELIYVTNREWVEPFEQFASETEALENADGPTYRNVKLGKIEYLANEVIISATGWRLVNLMPYSEAVAEITELRDYINVFSFSIAGGAILICTGMLIYMTMPLNRLFRRMGEIRIGGFRVAEKEYLTPVKSAGDAELRLNYMAKRIEDMSRMALKQQELEQNLRYETLRAQLNPHFLFNTLNTIKWSAMVSGAGNIADMLSSLGRLLESSMRRGEEFVSLKSELELVEAYLKIKNWTLKYRFALQINVEPELYEYRVFKFCLQPIVENAVVHGLDGVTDGVVSIQGRLSENCMLLQVHDNGCGMTPQRISEVLDNASEEDGVPQRISGVGLSTIDGMIRLRYGSEYGITIDSTPGNGTTVSIRLPCEQNTYGEEEE